MIHIAENYNISLIEKACKIRVMVGMGGSTVKHNPVKICLIDLIVAFKMQHNGDFS